MKLGLGTVQFGLNYGAFNRNGQVGREEIDQIVRFCIQEGILTVDTAPSYGESERVLGDLLPAQSGFKIVSKTPHFNSHNITREDVEKLTSVFSQSLEQLNKNTIYGLLIHNADDLLTQNGELLYKQMRDLKSCGLIEKVGVSVYTDSQINRIINHYDVDIIQLPINLYDQRLINRGILKRLKGLNIEIHARSVFLQGLILTEPSGYPPYFDPYRKTLMDLYNQILENHLTPMQMAIGFLKYIEEIDNIIVGVENIQQLKEIVDCYKFARNTSDIDYSKFSIDDVNILNPVNWKV